MSTIDPYLAWTRRGLGAAGLPEWPILVALAAAAALVWGFVEIAQAVAGGGTRALDTRLLLALRDPADTALPLGPRWLREAVRDVTALGGTVVLTMMTLATAAYLVMARMPRTALLVLLAVGSGLVLSNLLKWGFDRPRPDLVPHGSLVSTSSFPSGHAAMSAVVYLTLGALLARVQTRRRLKAFFMLSALAVTIVVGISRVYLGVHWPTDVLAGWSIGAAWALLCWLAAPWFRDEPG